MDNNAIRHVVDDKVKTLEVRVGAQGVKAKWVRVELRKVETLPGGGQQNTFFDFIGPSPINVWAADEREEWKELQTVSFLNSAIYLRTIDGNVIFHSKISHSSSGFPSLSHRA